MKSVIRGFALESSGHEECLCEIVRHLSACRPSTGKWLACFNPHSYVTSLADSTFSRALRSADWLVPDGVGAVIACRFLGYRIRSRITGYDIFEGLMRRAEQHRYTVFFIGSTEHILRACTERAAKEFPGVRVVGTFSPPFRASFSDADLVEMRRAINSVGCDILWVGMTAPKQEKWIVDNLPHLKARFAAGIGAVFDFYARTVPRAPTLVQRIGLEWLFRLLQQPRRLWRRTFYSAPVFVAHVVIQKVSMVWTGRSARRR